METTNGHHSDRRERRAALRSRVTMAAVIALCAALVVLAVTSQFPAFSNPQFIQDGHWVYSDARQSAFHVDGASAQVDAQVPVLGAEPGSQVVQGERAGYVVQRTRITQFSKATLRVEDTLTPPATERPVVLEIVGGPYLVYRNAGQVVRLGDPVATVATGGPLSQPTATSDGTIWLHRLDTGSLCSLMRSAARLVCHAQLPPGHNGSLTIVGDQSVLVDTTSDTLRTVGERGLGEPVAIGADLPASAYIAGSAATDRLAIVDPEHAQLLLLDTAGLDNRPAAKPIVTDLPKDGRFVALATTANIIAVIDQTHTEVLTFNRTGSPTGRSPIPGGSEPRLTRGDDGRIYVDSADGSHVLVVDSTTGSIKGVKIGGETSAPSAPPTPIVTVAPTATAGSVTEDPTRPVGPPAAAPDVKVSTTSVAVVVTWNQPDLRSGTLVHYLITAPGQPSRKVSALTTRYVGISGRVTVRAVTRFGPSGSQTILGKPASVTVSLKAPTIRIVSVRSVSGNLLVTVQATTEGAPGICKAVFSNASSPPTSCAGSTELNLGPVAWFGAITVTATIANAAGGKSTSWTGVPTVGG